MGTHYFTEQEIQQLKDNPYVEKVSEKSIKFSEEFKELFDYDYKNGMPPSTIFKKYGINPKTLGKKRLSNFVQRIKLESGRLNGFTDLRKTNSGRTKIKNLTPEERIEQLEYKNKILQQENDFLKRIRFINKKQLSKTPKD